MKKFRATYWLCALAAWSCLGCASMNATHLAHLRPGAGLTEQFKAMTAQARLDYYAQYRLTWDGHQTRLGSAPIRLPDLALYLGHCGAQDLAQAVDKAEPTFRTWAADHPFMSNLGDTNTSVGGGGDADLFILSAIVAGTAAYVATDSLVKNIYSTLDPNPSLEDVLEAYNQRLAAALGMNPADSALVTSMPHPLGMSGRDRARSLRLVRAGIAVGLIAMIVGSIDFYGTPNRGNGDGAWAKPVFLGGAGLLVGSVIFGYTVAW